MSLFEIVAKGGFMIIPIVICSILSIAILVERLLALRRMQINARTFIMKIRGMVFNNQITEADRKSVV